MSNQSRQTARMSTGGKPPGQTARMSTGGPPPPSVVRTAMRPFTPPTKKELQAEKEAEIAARYTNQARDTRALKRAEAKKD